MEVLKEAIVLVVGSELERVLVVSEKCVVSVGQISESAALENGEVRVGKGNLR